ncbi:MAG: hypothetical protein N2Z22_03135 [Turneriella sp.]|nr:hypothetical protein [Turneriella sp.]
MSPATISEAIQQLNRLRIFLAALLAQQRWRPVWLAAVLFVLWEVLNYLPKIYFPHREFQDRLNQLIDNSQLAISYQGIETGLFRGIKIIGLRISFDRDFARGRYLLEAPAVYLRRPVPLTTLSTVSVADDVRIIFENAKISYFVTADGSDREVRQQARDLLRQGLRYHAECIGCRFYLNVKDNSYFQEVTPVEELSFTLQNDGQQVKALLSYKSSVIGTGDFFARFGACSARQCSDLQGYWYLKSSKFRLAILNNFQKRFKIADGIATGEIAFDRVLHQETRNLDGKPTVLLEPRSNFRMQLFAQNLLVVNNKEPWLALDAFSTESRIHIRGNSASGTVHAQLNDYEMLTEFSDLRPDALPEKYFFRVAPVHSRNTALPLTSGQSLTGLQNFSISLAGRKGTSYTESVIRLQLENGSYLAGLGMPPIKLPVVKLELADGKLTGSVQAVVGQSAVQATISGTAELYPVSHKPISDPLLREPVGPQERTIFALRGKIQCPVMADSIFWQDLVPFIDALLNGYWKKVQEGMQYSWLPSHFRRREYFVRFLENTDFSMPIEIKRFHWGPEIALRGKLYFSPSYNGGGFTLESVDKKNSLSLIISYGGYDPNAPYMSYDLDLDLEQAYALLKPWWGDDYFDYFSQARITHTDHFMGERPADHVLKSSAWSSIRLSRVRLGQWATEQALPLQWESVDIRTSYSNGYGVITSLRAENPGTALQGHGEYLLFDRKLNTNLKYQIVAN